MTEVGLCTRTISTREDDITIYSLRDLEEKGIIKDLSKIPYSVKIFIEGMRRWRTESTSPTRTSSLRRLVTPREHGP